MKKNLTILKTVFLFLFAVFLLQSCRNETIIDSTQENSAHKSKTLATLKEVLEATSLKTSKDVMARSTSISSLYNPNEYEMDTLTIRKTFNDNETTEYAIALKKKNETEKGVFYNLVFTKKDNKWKKFLIKLTPEYYKDTELITRHRIEIISSESSKKGMKSASCDAQYYSYEYFSCNWGHTNPYDGDCGECWVSISTGFSYNCDQESINRDFNIGGDSVGGGGGGGVGVNPYELSAPLALNFYLQSKGGVLLSSEETAFLNSNVSLANSLKYYFLNNENDNSPAFFHWTMSFLIQNPNTSWSQFQNWFIDGALDYTNPNDVSFAGNLANLSNDLRLANQNGTLNQLQASWPNWQKIKQDIKNAIARGIHDGAKTVKTYYDEVRNNPYIYNSGTRVFLNTYIDELREEVRQKTNMNKDTMKWEDLFKIWLFELMPSKYQNTINFTWASNVVNGNNLYNSTTNAVYTFPKGEPSILPNIKNGLKNGNITVGQSIKGTFTYNFNQYYATLSKNNIGIQMLGSYDIKATVISKSGNVAVIRFFITNPLNWDSATRFVQNGTKTIGVVKNKEIGDELHIGGNLTNTYTWDEIITF